MTIRTDVTVDFTQSPRIITVAPPSTTITIQDLNDTLRSIEYQQPSGLQQSSLLAAAGKTALGSGVYTGVTLILQNAQLAFAARAGPATTQCTVSGGNLVAVDVNGNVLSPISPTAFTQVVLAQSTEAALLSSTASATTTFETTGPIVADYEDTALPLELAASLLGTGGVTGLAPTVAIRDAVSSKYLDWNDMTFKSSGWTTKNKAMTDLGTGVYQALLNVSVLGYTLANLPERLVAEYTVAGVNASLLRDTITVGAQATQTTELHVLSGLDKTKSLVVTPSLRTAGTISQTITESGSQVTVTRS